MPKILVPGRYTAKVMDAEFGESPQTGTPFLSIEFEVEDGSHIWGYLYLTEKAFDYSLKTLKDAFGFDGNFDTLVAQLRGKECSISCDWETGPDGKERMKVQWINAARKSAPMANRDAFLAQCTARARGAHPAATSVAPQPPARPPIPARRPAPATPASEDCPF